MKVWTLSGGGVGARVIRHSGPCGRAGSLVVGCCRLANFGDRHLSYIHLSV